ncbi:MAG TPA: hypothetical protein VHW44_14650 [Pseudonocardiaceae bacterium]|nr:hypothetical protein [Pseudonocardiaceae bacterium]
MIARRGFVAAVVLTAVVAGCSSATTGTSPAPMTGMADMSGMAGMAGMAPAPSASPLAMAAPGGTGLAGAVGGYSLAAVTETVPAGAPGVFAFRISGPDGRTVTRYQPDDGQLMLFDLVRSDLTGYQHGDPAMREDGTWNVSLPALAPGAYRAYVSFAAPDTSAGTPLVYVLSRPFTVPGPVSPVALPPPATGAVVGGVTVRLAGRPAAGAVSALTLDFSSGGKPVGYFQRYLDGYAHLIAFHVGDLATVQLSPATKATKPSELTSQGLFPETGSWRVFVGFQIAGPVQTAAFTITVP